MKFLNLVTAAISFAPAVLGAVVAVEQRQTTPATAIKNSLAYAQTGLEENEKAIAKAVVTVQNNVEAVVQVTAILKANLGAIADGLVQAAAEIKAAIEAATYGVGGQVTGLVQAEVDALQVALEILVKVILGINATIYVKITNLLIPLQAAIDAEVKFVLDAIAPLVNPLMIFVDAVENASAEVGVVIRGVSAAYVGVEAAVAKLGAANGIPAVKFPGYPA